MRLECEVFARTGLLGNPSDGYFGKTIACLVGNFKARVAFTESASLRLEAHPRFDPLEFQSIAELASVFGDQGYYGGQRLVQATLKRFFEVCAARGIVLDGPNFTLSYDTGIPRQVGMAGSSAIIIATLRCLLGWYHLYDQLAQWELPTIAMETETEELGITAGMMDRVVQTYGGALYMNFAQELLTGRGYGDYTRIAPNTLPPLYIAFVLHGAESGKIHSDVRRRWNAGDPEVRAAMCEFAGFAEAGRAALDAGDFQSFGALMNANFALRRRIFGDGVLGPDNLRMAELAQRYGFPATTCGSGGAIVGIQGDEERHTAFTDALTAEGFHVQQVTVGPEYGWHEVSS